MLIKTHSLHHYYHDLCFHPLLLGIPPGLAGIQKGSNTCLHLPVKVATESVSEAQKSQIPYC